MGWGQLAVMAVTAIASAYSSYSSSKSQQASYEAQAVMSENEATIARQNAEIAEEAGREEARTGYENKLKKRQEVALLIGEQRAQQGASGAVVDSGSLLDVNMDTAEKGEIDALALEQEGFDKQYQYNLQASNYNYQADVADAQAAAYADSASSINPWLSTVPTILSGAVSGASSYAGLTSGIANTASTASNIASNLGSYSSYYNQTKWF